MIGERLTQLRLARNLTLDALSAKMGGIVTKQALSKYEQNQAQPSPLVLTRLSVALGVKASYFLSSPQINVKFVAYRKATSLLEREKARVKSVVTQCLEDRIRIQTLVGQTKTNVLPWNTLEISSLEDSEKQASHMRNLWELGSGPIRDVVGTFEEHQLCVLSIDADEKFDGLSALGSDTSGNILAGAIVSRQDVPGERQRLNLTHELGHLVLNIPDSLDEEVAAFRFGSAFLVPAERLIKEVGAKRSYIHISELLILKKQFGISLQALLHRMLDLGIINDSYYRRWCIYISKSGWKKHEPDEMERERPQWLSRNLSRLVGEGAITRDEAERLLGASIDVDEPTNIMQRHAFLKLPVDKRRLLLAQQAKLLSEYYEKEAEYLVSEDVINDY
ncbi:MAG: XRE family transcriptional regulator [Dehalococcoidia bacterium]|jgi:transcriptional regulator with XRE-family HTH domain